MTLLRLKQIGWSLCLMTSLLFGSASACLCSHHEKKVDAPGASCHASQHKAVETIIESPVDQMAADIGCRCLVNQQTPAATSKSENKKVQVKKAIRTENQSRTETDLVSFGASLATSFPGEDCVYTHAFERFGPSRAPPRL